MWHKTEAETMTITQECENVHGRWVTFRPQLCKLLLQAAIFSLSFRPVLQLQFSPNSHVNPLVYFTFIPSRKKTSRVWPISLCRQGGEGLIFFHDFFVMCRSGYSRQWLVCRGVCMSLLLIMSDWIMAPSLNKNIICDVSKRISVPGPINNELTALASFFLIFMLGVIESFESLNDMCRVRRHPHMLQKLFAKLYSPTPQDPYTE